MIGADILRQVELLKRCEPGTEGDFHYTELYRTVAQFRAVSQQVVIQAQKAIAVYDRKRDEDRKQKAAAKRKAMAIYKGNLYTR